MTETAGTGSADPGLFARTWRLSNPGYPDRSALSALVEVVVPEIEALEGYRGGNIMVDRNGGDIYATTFWDTMEHLRAAHDKATNAAAGLLVISNGAAMEHRICDVVLSTPVPRVVNTDLGPGQA